MAPGAVALAMMAGGGDEDGNVDPRTQLMRSAVLNNMMGEGTDESSETGGEVGKRHIDQGTTSPSAAPAEQTPEQFEDANTPSARLHGSLLNLQAARSQGVDDTENDMMNRPLPSTFPATSAREEAQARLKKAEAAPEVQPLSGGKKALSAILATIPIVGPAYGHMQRGAYQRGQRDILNARTDYSTQAELEQKQRDQALREKVAMSNMMVNKAIREATLAVRSHGIDVTGANAAGRNAVNAAGKGYDLTTNPDGTPKVTSRPAADLSEVQKRSMELQQATEELKKAQKLAIPEQIKIKEEALKQANERLSIYLQNTEFHQDLAREEADFRELGPTTMMRDRSQQSNVIKQAGEDLINNIGAHREVLGPLMGRVGSLKDFIGNPPPEYAKLASELTTYIALQPAAHGFRGMRAVQEFEKSIGSPIRTPEALIAAIEGNMTGLGPMSQAGQYTPLVKAHPMSATPASGPRSTLKKNSPGAQGGGTRNVTRGPDGKLQLTP